MNEREFAIQYCERLVKLIREDLASYYNVESLEYENYRGLCDIACNKFMNVAMHDNDVYVRVRLIHGEQKHKPNLISRCWAYEHTWMQVMVNGVYVYADPTSGQFKNLYSDIPDYYISTKKPKWYYPDKRNPAFNGLTRMLNDRIKLNIKVPRLNGNGMCNYKIGIIEYLQRFVWGRISDKIGGHR